MTQEEASDDYRRLKMHSGTWVTRRPKTIRSAIEHVISQARNRGVPATTIAKGYVCYSRYLLRFWHGDRPVTQITKGDIIEFVRVATERGRSPNTLIHKDLPMIGRILRAGGAPDLIPEVREELSQTLKRVPPQMHYFQPRELNSVLHRIRTAEFVTVEVQCTACSQILPYVLEKNSEEQLKCRSCASSLRRGANDVGRRLSILSREFDADVIEFVALTGIRPGELGRIRLIDFDDARKRIRVVSKDRGHPRFVEVQGRIGELFERLRSAAISRHKGADTKQALLVPNGMNRLNGICARWKKRLGEPRLSGRTLRHTFVTGLLYSGAMPVEAMGLAGHRRLDTTDRYTHEISQRRVAVLLKWQHHLLGEGAAIAHADATDSPRASQSVPTDPPPEPSDPPPTP